MSAKRSRKHPIDQKITNSKKFGNGEKFRKFKKNLKTRKEN